MSKLQIALIQSFVDWERKTTNLHHFTVLLEKCDYAADLIVLPETFQTGFSMHAAKLAESMDGESVRWMKEQAFRFSCCIAGSLIIQEGSFYYNRFLFVHHDGRVDFYDKRHLFGYGGEGKQFEKGAGPVDKLIVVKDWNIVPRICYDLRFPVWNRFSKDADLLLFTANWPDTRIEHWDALLKARAIENQVFTAGLNRIGTDGNGLIYPGHSSVYGYDGKCLMQLNDEDDILAIQLDKSDQIAYRTKFPFLRDADQFKIS